MELYCTATHPKKPNFSGHARGRCIHISIDSSKTKCNMLVDQILNDSPNVNYLLASRRKCKVCFQSVTGG